MSHPTPSTKAICVFTSHGLDAILAAQGSQAWVLDRKNAVLREYVVCTHNRRKNENDAQPSTMHRTAFVVGRLKDVVRSPLPDCQDRWLLVFSEYAEIDTPEVWPEGKRNPVWYTNLEELGIDASQLDFKKMPAVTPQVTPSAPAAQPSATPQQGLTIAQAKAGLAMTYGVEPSAIEIVVRG